MKKKNSLKIELVQSKPDKVYKIEVQYDHQIDDVCKFIRNNKDKNVSMVINGKHTKFNSFAGKKRFASGYSQGGDFVLGHTKELFKKTQRDTKDLKANLSQAKKELAKQTVIAVGASDKLRVNNTVKKLRQAAYADHVKEINDDRALLKERLDKLEPIIRLVLKAKTDGQLQAAFKLAKKSKL